MATEPKTWSHNFVKTVCFIIFANKVMVAKIFKNKKNGAAKFTTFLICKKRNFSVRYKIQYEVVLVLKKVVLVLIFSVVRVCTTSYQYDPVLVGCQCNKQI